MNQHVSHHAHKPVTPERRIVEEAIHFADRAGWQARLTKISEEECAFELEVGGTPLRIGPPGKFHFRQTDQKLDLPLPWEAALQAFEAAVSCTSGHATILAPVGSFGSPAPVGAIDSVIVGPPAQLTLSKSANWSVSCAAVSHTRCWMINLTADCQIATGRPPCVGKGGYLTVLPEWMGLRDTATLCEFARDCGWADARFPHVVVLEWSAKTTASGVKVSAWLAVTDAAASVSLAGQIGEIVASQLSPTDHHQQIMAVLSPNRGSL